MNDYKISNIFVCLLLMLLLSACALFSPTESWRRTINPPSQFSLYSEHPDNTRHWWKDFNNDDLNRLVDEAISENFSIREAWTRLAQSHYSAIKAGADKYPQLFFQADGAYVGKKSKGTPRTSTEEWLLGFSASYEIDLWGRVRAEKESSSVLVQATKEDLKTAIMTVAGQIAENWISLISKKKQQKLFTKQLELQKKLLELVKKRFSLAKSTALDIYQQQQAIEKIETALIPLISREATIKRRLALLTGKASIEYFNFLGEEFPQIGETPSVGLPADLIAARPDIRAAGLRLKSAQWEVAAARADRLPALKLTASHILSAEEIGSICNNWLLTLAGNLAGPIFDGNRRQAEVARTRAVVDERIAFYTKTVFTAIKEVEDAMADENQYAETINSLKKQLELSEKTMREARRRYLNGKSDFMNVLREEFNILLVRQNIITAEEDMIIARINLYKALGGAWVDSYVE